MTIRKSKSEPRKAKKLTLNKFTVKDLTASRGGAKALRGGAPKAYISYAGKCSY